MGQLKWIFKIMVLAATLYSTLLFAATLPNDFVYLKTVDPSIEQDIRYAGYHNFVGRPIYGYLAPECILTRQAATALKSVQKEAKKYGLSLKVYDCYRPQMAVEDFYQWSQQPTSQSMKAEFYPRVAKEDLFKLEYIARYSGHSRGSTVDLTLVPLTRVPSAVYHPGQKLHSCFAPYTERFHDNSLDMGTGYDCMDRLSHLNAPIHADAAANRKLLGHMMHNAGFKPYAYEWWHFTLNPEPYPYHFFNFPIE